MKEKHYNITPVRQELTSDCVQANAALLLSHYGIHKTIDELKQEVPVTRDAEGNLIGSSVGHIAAYFLSLGLKTTLHVSDIQLFDQTWDQLSARELIDNIEARKPHIKHTVYGQDILGVICDGYTQFLKNGGNIIMPTVDEAYLHSLLETGPIFCIINYQYLFKRPRTIFTTDTDSVNDPITGQLTTHVITIIGYKDGQFEIIDSVRPVSESKVWVSASRLIAAYHLADIDLDSLLITITK